jgi:hypothetical protein
MASVPNTHCTPDSVNSRILLLCSKHLQIPVNLLLTALSPTVTISLLFNNDDSSHDSSPAYARLHLHHMGPDKISFSFSAALLPWASEGRYE